MNRIRITLNGEPQALPENATLAELLAASGQAAQSVSTAVNAQFVPRELRHCHRLSEGDAVFTFAPITGG